MWRNYKIRSLLRTIKKNVTGSSRRLAQEKKSSKGIYLLQDNARPHISNFKKRVIEEEFNSDLSDYLNRPPYNKIADTPVLETATL